MAAVRTSLLACALALVSPALAAAEAAHPELYFRHADFADARLSPSGRTLAAIAVYKGRRALLAMDVATRKPHVVAAGDRDVRTFFWVTEKRLVFHVHDLQRGSGERNFDVWYAANVDGSDRRIVAETFGRYEEVVGPAGDGVDAVLVANNFRNGRYLDLYRVDLADRGSTLLTDDWPGDPVRWVADRKGVVRAALTTERGLRTRTWWRKAKDAPWQLVNEGTDDANVAPVEFDADGSLIVTSRVGRDTTALHRLDTTTMTLGSALAAHPHADIDSVIVRDGRVVGAYYDDGRPGAVWFDDAWARLAATIDGALPNHRNRIFGGGGGRYLVHSASDVEPGKWYLYESESRKLEFLFASRRDVRAESMPKREAVRYAARDGLPIPAIVTLPNGREARSLPLVLLVHGGPWIRGTHWTWQAEPAFLASLGYAVLEPDFRGSTGWGRRHFHAGFRQWGRAMQDDLVDGIDWLAARGTIDPKRVCIMGGSYGGYATMSALARDADRFRCGVNLFGVTDLGLYFDVAYTDYAYSDFIRYRAKDLVGDPEREADQFRTLSPLSNAAKIRAPVFMAYGARDRRVPLVHGERMQAALKRNGASPEFVVYDGEGHGLLLEKNRFDLYSRIAAFLREHLPPE